MEQFTKQILKTSFKKVLKGKNKGEEINIKERYTLKRRYNVGAGNCVMIPHHNDIGPECPTH